MVNTSRQVVLDGGGRCERISNDRTGTMAIRNSTLQHNPNDRFHTPGLPGIYFLGARRPAISHSVVRTRGVPVFAAQPIVSSSG